MEINCINMNTEEKIRELFGQLSRTQKVNFISDRLEYATDASISSHIGAYIFDWLEDLYEDGRVYEIIEFLKQKGYEVAKQE